MPGVVCLLPLVPPHTAADVVCRSSCLGGLLLLGLLWCVSTALRVGACVMLNILGEGSMDETKALVSKALSVPGAGVHWYGKAEAKKGKSVTDPHHSS